MSTDTLEPDAEAPAVPDAEEALAEADESLLRRLEDAQARYREVVIAASDGDPQAGAEARALELQISSLVDEAKRESLAKEMRRRQALAEREQQLREQRVRDQEEYAALLDQRDEAFAGARRALAAFAAAARNLFAVEAQAQDLAARCETRFLSERGTLSYAVAVVGRDCHLDDDVIGWVPARSRARLLERFPDLLDHDEPVEVAEPAASARCSVCMHERRAEIEAALEAGSSYREVAAKFGVSRGALTRHKQHSGVAV
jgi:hypothetical protein